MNVFLSWSGDISRSVATALRTWLPDVIQQVRPWFSETDIAVGTVWREGISSALENCHFGIICVTPELLLSDWAMFEAGALSKQVGERRVIPYLVGVSQADITGPLASFQTVSADKPGTYEMTRAINDLCQTPLDASRVESQFNRLWPELDSSLQSLQFGGRKEGDAPSRQPWEILTEVLEITRRLERKMADDNVQSVRIRRPIPTKTFDNPFQESRPQAGLSEDKAPEQGAPEPVPRQRSKTTLGSPSDTIPPISNEGDE